MRSRVGFGLGLVIFTALAASVALAHEYAKGDLHIGHPWVRLAPPGAPTLAGYLTVANHGRAADRLVSVDAVGVKSVEPHSMSMAGGVMRMRMLPDGFEIPAGGTLTLAPGGDHLMLIGPARDFKAGERIAATLHFKRAGDVKVEFLVQEPPAQPQGGMGGMKM